MSNILVIDDESLLLGLVSTTLHRDGHTVTAMTDPLAAIDSFVTERVPIDLLLIDVSMEPISGFEIMTRMINAGFDGSALFMSGSAALSGAIVRSLGSYAVIGKPFTAEKLRTAVRRALAKSKVKSPRVPQSTSFHNR